MKSVYDIGGMPTVFQSKCGCFRFFRAQPNNHLTHTAYRVTVFWASGVYLVCTKRKRALSCAKPYVLYNIPSKYHSNRLNKN